MMTASPLSALLIDAPMGRHFAQLHRDSDGLTRSVTQFIEAGLRRKDGLVVIAGRDTTPRIRGLLERNELDVDQHVASGQLALLDAEATLAQFMRKGQPDWTEFRRVVGNALESVQPFGRGRTRAYGEMVNVLWRDGQQQAAIRLEEYWNDLGKLYPFCLLCGYMLDSHHAHTYHGPLHEIGRTHSDVIATHEDERFRDALDQACQDIFGVRLSHLVSMSGQEDVAGEQRLPDGQRTMLWIMRHLPASSGEVLERVRGYYGMQT
jgi:hypothetical protein